MEKQAQLVVHTPHGTVEGKWQSVKDVEEVYSTLKKFSADLHYLELETVTGKTLILKNTLYNSIVKIKTRTRVE